MKIEKIILCKGKFQCGTNATAKTVLLRLLSIHLESGPTGLRNRRSLLVLRGHRPFGSAAKKNHFPFFLVLLFYF